jgi:hypothetical protein
LNTLEHLKYFLGLIQLFFHFGTLFCPLILKLRYFVVLLRSTIISVLCCVNSLPHLSWSFESFIFLSFFQFRDFLTVLITLTYLILDVVGFAPCSSYYVVWLRNGIVLLLHLFSAFSLSSCNCNISLLKPHVVKSIVFIIPWHCKLVDCTCFFNIGGILISTRVSLSIFSPCNSSYLFVYLLFYPPSQIGVICFLSRFYHWLVLIKLFGWLPNSVTEISSALFG